MVIAPTSSVRRKRVGCPDKGSSLPLSGQKKTFDVRVAVSNLIRLIVEVDPISEHSRLRNRGTGFLDKGGVLLFQIFPHADLRR